MSNGIKIDENLNRQREYIRKFKNSIWYKIYKTNFEKIGEDKESFGNFTSEEELRVNAQRLYYIYSLRLQRWNWAYREKISSLLFVLKNNKICILNKKEIKQTKNDYLAVACIVKNEGRYILEWVEFYFSLGVDRIFLFDNESADDTRLILDKYIENGKVIYIYFPGKKLQLNAYNYALRIYKGKWLAFLDADEFLFPMKEEALPDVLRQYEKYPGVGVNWKIFTYSGIRKRPEGLVTQNYIKTLADTHHYYNCTIKSIVQPKYVLASVSPHYCLYKKGAFAVDENKNEISGQAGHLAYTMGHSENVLRINHYITKSKEEFFEKIERGYPDGRKMKAFSRERLMEDQEVFDDMMIQRIVEKMSREKVVRVKCGKCNEKYEDNY